MGASEKHAAAFHPGDGPTPRIHEECPVCGDRLDVPDKGLGRATAAAWRTRHQHREETRRG